MSAHTVDYIIKWMFSIYSALYTVNIYENHSFSHLYAEFFFSSHWGSVVCDTVRQSI